MGVPTDKHTLLNLAIIMQKVLRCSTSLVSLLNLATIYRCSASLSTSLLSLFNLAIIALPILAIIMRCRRCFLSPAWSHCSAPDVAQSIQADQRALVRCQSQ